MDVFKFADERPQPLAALGLQIQAMPDTLPMTLQYQIAENLCRLYPGSSWNGLGGTFCKTPRQTLSTLGGAATTRPLPNLLLVNLQNSSMEVTDEPASQTQLFILPQNGSVSQRRNNAQNFTIVLLLLILQNGKLLELFDLHNLNDSFQFHQVCVEFSR